MLERTTDLLNKATTAKAEDVDAIKAAWARPKSLHQLGVNYRWISIVIDEQHPYHAADQSSALDPYGDGEFTELRAGDRAPDAPGLVNTIGDTQTSLFSLFKSTHHTIILFTSDLSEIGPIVKVLSSWPVGQVKLVVVAPKDTAIGQPSLPGVDLVLRDQAGHGYNEYRSVVQTNFKVVVIRPDGVIGGILKDEEGLKRYSSGILYTTA